MSTITINNSNKVTDDMYCPITYQLMVDPVMDPEGFSYERTAISEWLSRNQVSPLTRNPLKISQLIPNRALKSAIDDIRNSLNQEQLVRKTQLSEKCTTEMLSILQSSLDNIKSISFFNKNTNELHLKLIVPDSETRAPVHICLIIDVSGSMGMEATMKGANGQVESHGFSLLDIVKQAAHAIRVTLSDIDSLSIVKYSSNSQVILEPTLMNQTGKALAESSINSLVTEGQTNIWDGLCKGLDICRLNKTDGRNDKIILLTDGQANIIPPRGHVGMINKYKDEHMELPASIDTFGFGYNLDSKDLNSISVSTNGNYGFIPDSSMVGDLFSNCIANFMSTAVTNASISFELNNGLSLDDSNPILGNHNIVVTQWGVQIETGALYYGQDKDFILRLKNINNQINVSTKYSHFGEIKEEFCNDIREFNEDSEIQKIRLESVEAIYNSYNQMRFGNSSAAEEIIKSHIENLKASPLKNNSYVKDILIDLTEQVTIAITNPNHFQKWGQHYLPSLARAHQQQVCNNFRDPGVQLYGGTLFKKMRDIADDKFNSLPAPVPTAINYGCNSGSSGSLRVATLASYNSHSGPCFAKESLIKMSDGSLKKVDKVKKGDRILSYIHGNLVIDEIECVLKTYFREGQTMLVKLESGWLGTPNHPIKKNGEWIHPKSLSKPKMMECDYVFSFLLKNRTTVIINDFESATFAHNLSDNNVIEHDYFGTEKVVSDLKKFVGWNNGLIEIVPECIVRDPQTGFVVEIREMKISVSV